LLAWTFLGQAWRWCELWVDRLWFGDTSKQSEEWEEDVREKSRGRRRRGEYLEDGGKGVESTFSKGRNGR